MRTYVRLALAQLARDRWTTPIWLLGIAALGAAAASAVAREFASEADRAAIVVVVSSNPAFLFLRGAPDGTGVGAVVFVQAFSFMAVLAGLMSTFLVVRHTRADEELGRGELVAATVVRRTAPLTATVALGVAANAVLALLVAAGFLVGGLPADGAVIAGLAVGAVGLVFTGVAAVVAQLATTGRAANGMAAATVGAAYLLRGVGDALGTPSDDLLRVESAWPSWLSPIGWAQRSTPFSDPDPSRLLIHVVAFVVLVVVAVAIRHARDLGWGVIRERSGSERATAWGRSLPGLTWRLQRGSAVGWCVGGAALGLVAGIFGPVVAELTADNESLADLLGRLAPGGRPDIVDAFTAALLGMAGVLAAAAGTQAVLRLRAEEAEGRVELLLAASATRTRWLLTNLGGAIASVVAVALVSGVAAGLGAGATTGDAGAIARFAGAALAHAPAALVFVSVTALALALIPRATVALGWGLLTAGLVLGQFGELLRLPDWVQATSPFHHSSAVPVEDFDALSAGILIVIAAALAAAATLFYRRRDLVA
jgi:ABC-2 type transport system permease protein